MFVFTYLIPHPTASAMLAWFSAGLILAMVSVATCTGVSSSTTVEEVQQWFAENGFGSPETLCELYGKELCALTEERLAELTPAGKEIHAALHGSPTG